MSDREKIQAAIQMLKRLKRMVGFFMKRDIAELIDRLEEPADTGYPDSTEYRASSIKTLSR